MYSFLDFFFPYQFFISVESWTVGSTELRMIAPDPPLDSLSFSK